MFNVQRFNTQKFNTQDFNADGLILHHHLWVTVPNPVNRRMLLQACDNCGVVKSPNTVRKNCSAEPKQNIITKALHAIER